LFTNCLLLCAAHGVELSSTHPSPYFGDGAMLSLVITCVCLRVGASGSLGLAPQQQQQLQQLTNGVQLTPAMLQAAAKAMAASGGLEHLNRMRSAGAAWW